MRKNSINIITQNLLKLDILLNQNSPANPKFINPDHFITSAKQLIKLLSFYLTRNKKAFVYFVVQTEMQQVFVSKCLEYLNVTKYINVFSSVEDLKSDKKKAIVLLIGKNQNYLKVVKQLYLNNKYLIYYFDSDNLNYNWGTFFCMSKIDDVKSLLYLTTLVANIVKKIKIKNESNT